MKERPWPIILIAVVCIFAPVFNIIYSSIAANKNIINYLTLMAKTNSLFELIGWVLLPLLVGYSILAFNFWSYYLFLAFMCIVSYICFHEWQRHPENISVFSFFILETFNLATIGYFLLPSVRMIYFTPQIRWWQQRPRYLCSINVLLKNSLVTASGTIKNISLGGVLISSNEDFKLKDVFDIYFEIEGIKVHTFSRVVHKATDGYGLMFLEVKSNYNEYKKTLNELKNRGYKLRTEFPPWTQSFVDWAITLLKTGKGIIPRPERYEITKK